MLRDSRSEPHHATTSGNSDPTGIDNAARLLATSGGSDSIPDTAPCRYRIPTRHPIERSSIATAQPATPPPTTSASNSFLFKVLVTCKHDKTQFGPTGAHLLEASKISKVIWIIYVWFFEGIESLNPTAIGAVFLRTNFVGSLGGPPHIDQRLWSVIGRVIFFVAIIEFRVPWQGHLLGEESRLKCQRANRKTRLLQSECCSIKLR